MPWVTSDDFLETLAKLRQRGLPFLLSKLTPSSLARTRSAFDDPRLQAANWWQVPAVRQRWNEKISGDAATAYETHVADRYLAGRTGLRLLSLGSGACSHELTFARQAHFAEVRCVDIAGRLLQQAAPNRASRGTS